MQIELGSYQKSEAVGFVTEVNKNSKKQKPKK